MGKWCPNIRIRSAIGIVTVNRAIRVLNPVMSAIVAGKLDGGPQVLRPPGSQSGCRRNACSLEVRLRTFVYVTLNFCFCFRTDLVPEAGTVRRIGSENVTVTIVGVAGVGRGIDGGAAGPEAVIADVPGNVNVTIVVVAVLRSGLIVRRKLANSRTVATITKVLSSPRA